MIKVGVLGASGRMGSLIIQSIVKNENLELSSAFDLMKIGMDAGEVAQAGNLGVPISDINDLGAVLKDSNTDVLIDFTIADATTVNAPIAASCGVKLVIGTTGLNPEQKEIVESSIAENNIAAVIAPNYAVGVNVFFRIIKEAAKYLADNDIEIIEAHHNQKQDAPSGTALKAAEVIAEEVNKTEFVYGRHGKAPRGDEIGIHAVRGGDIAGDHTVLFAGSGERIEIKHQAHTRQAFASGVVKAAEWVASKGPGIYSMEDILGFN
ncbi:4-hydroxy-tetrahydrodipicolinate reductase [Methanohalophilus levihalophilus]|uniref:4-hydroxy-tetrahydrodipicolinate reductase n=1 Tax=Methanohalophilus levihalophilus TaxID=1431282 RepID=UPI001AE2882D|nr:4-hydroxy-tetrahydrodipicolinate reductase [Methanohalophilus levihalophilus]MBP2029286.1 4-hydroxy-tetrahydrodipicolinate reductase [Methanohalophilus levihalophilus]